MPGKRIFTASKRVRLSTAALLACGLLAAQYDQPYRPQYHFSPARNWTNDPNGTVWFDGEYHLFFQYNPFGDQWGHMSWGHAVSPDLIHWRELGVALPEQNGVMIFTGSTVVDERNSSGFCVDGKPCMVAVYTGHTPESPRHPALQTQNLAWSNDRGRTWTKYPGNPVLNLNLSDFRDPDVFWSEEGRRWIMVVSLPNDHKVRFYGSADLKKWTALSDFGPAGATAGQWECPNFFRLPVKGTRDTRWVLKVGLNPGSLQGGSGEQYFVGRFDGTRFVNDNPRSLTLWTDYGKDCYCALTFNHLPQGEAPVMIGWMNNWQYAGKVPTSPWRGQMTIPRRLALVTERNGIRLVQEPDRKDDRSAAMWSGTSLDELNAHLAGAAPATHSFRVRFEAAPGEAKQFGLEVLAGNGSGTTIGYDRERGELSVDRTHSGEVAFSGDFPARTTAPLTLGPAEPLRLDILVDRCSVEVFAQDGRVAMTNLVFPRPDAHGMKAWSRGGAMGRVSISVQSIPSIW